MSTTLRLTLNGLRARRRRLLGTSLAVLLGVAFLAGTLVLGDTVRANFDDLFGRAYQGTDAQVRNATSVSSEAMAPRGPIPASTAAAVRAVDGVAAAAPGITGYGRLLGADGEVVGGGGPPTLAGAWITDPRLNAYRLVEGRAPQADDEVVINRGAAKAGHLAIGDRTTVQVPDPVRVRIVGITTFDDADGLGPSTFTAFSLHGAQRHLLDGRAQVSTVLVRADDGVDQARLVRDLRRALPSSVEAISGTDLRSEATDGINAAFLDILTTFLTVFAGIALLVATFSIANTFSILVAQRTREAALLRSLGAGRAQVLGSVLLEALAVGAVASVVGVVAGLGIAKGLLTLFHALGSPLPGGGLTVHPTAAVVGLVAGLVVTVVAAVAPAVRSSRVAPLAALRDVDVDRTGTSRARLLAGSLLAAGGVAAAVAGVTQRTSGGGLALAGLGTLATAVGTIVLGPVVARRATAVLGAPIARWRGTTGVLARGNAMRSPRRTASTAAALTIGVAVVTLFTVFAASLKATVEDGTARSVTAPLAIDAGWSGGYGPALARDVGRVPGVAAAVGIGQVSARVDGAGREVHVADTTALGRVADLDVRAGSLARLGPDEVAVSTREADDQGWSVGTRLPVVFPDGARRTVTVAATYQRSDLVGGLLFPRPLVAPHTTQELDRVVLVATAPSRPVAQVRAAAQRVAARSGAEVVDRATFVGSAGAGLDRLLTLVYVMLALAIVIALMGIGNTLALSIHERARELGLLRAVGQTRRQLRSMIRWESVLIALFGTAGGLALGGFGGWALVNANPSVDLVRFVVPVASLAVVVVVGALAGVLAARRPARRAARLDVLAAIATDG